MNQGGAIRGEGRSLAVVAGCTTHDPSTSTSGHVPQSSRFPCYVTISCALLVPSAGWLVIETVKKSPDRRLGHPMKEIKLTTKDGELKKIKIKIEPAFNYSGKGGNEWSKSDTT